MADIKVTQQLSSKPPPIALGINVEKPKFPQYAIYSKRLESFELWPEYLPVEREDLVEAGLVYTGLGDSVRCYFCGGGLRNWERGDVPMEEHAKWYPKCPHMLLMKGLAYIEKLGRGEKPEIDGSNIEEDSVDEVNHLDSIAAQSCIEMDYSKEMVEKAIHIFIRKNGNSDFKGTDLCEILFDLEDNPEQQDIGIEEVDTKSINKEEDSRSVAVEEEIEPIETLLDENYRLKENQMCKICMDSRADVIFLPCGHMISCPQCAPALVKCPICRQVINGQLKALFDVKRKQ